MAICYGELFYPKLSTKQVDYFEHSCNSMEISLEKTAKSLFEHLSELIPLLKHNTDGKFSPNILLKDGDLFGSLIKGNIEKIK